jgi:hypothetical protein
MYLEVLGYYKRTDFEKIIYVCPQSYLKELNCVENEKDSVK